MNSTGILNDDRSTIRWCNTELLNIGVTTDLSVFDIILINLPSLTYLQEPVPLDLLQLTAARNTVQVIKPMTAVRTVIRVLIVPTMMGTSLSTSTQPNTWCDGVCVVKNCPNASGSGPCWSQDAWAFVWWMTNTIRTNRIETQKLRRIHLSRFCVSLYHIQLSLSVKVI